MASELAKLKLENVHQAQLLEDLAAEQKRARAELAALRSSDRPRGGVPFDVGKCHTCGKSGHRAYQCPDGKPPRKGADKDASDDAADK